MVSKIVVAATLAFFSTDVRVVKPDWYNQELYCLASNIYFEARGESLEGQVAVAEVTLNRVKSKRYPNSVCNVVFQKHQFSWAKQQPWVKIQKALNGLEPSKNKLELSAYQSALETARTVLKTDLNRVLPSNALWYHSTTVNPKWSRKMKKVKKVGKHLFYTKE